MIVFAIFGTIYALCLAVLVTVLVAGRPAERREPPGATQGRHADVTRSSPRWPPASA
jgi:hypothetical protein